MKKTVFTLFFISALIVSCNQKLEQGKLVSKEEFKGLGKLKENNGKRFSVLGHPFIDGDISVRQGIGKQLPNINFYEEPNGKGAMLGAFPVSNGKGKNEFYAPETFTMDDVIFYDNDGTPLKHTDKMQISFTMDLQVDRERSGSGDDMKYYGGPASVRIDKAK
jgi:hypothetical protein